MPHAPAGGLGVILSQFPRYDEAFILRELTALTQQGEPVTIFSLRSCRDRVVHDAAKRLVPQTVYAPYFWSSAVWASQAYVLRRSPRRYAAALWWIVSRHLRHPVILLKTLAFFPKTVHFARLAEARGLTHLHAFWATYPAAAALLISRLTGIPFSQSGHAHDIHTTNPTLAEKLQAARFTLTCTEHNRQYLQSLLNGHAVGGRGQETGGRRPVVPRPVPRAPRPSIIVSYHGVDLSRFTPAPKPERPACHLLCVGSLLPCKGLEQLIDACRLLKADGLAVRCTIAGGGPLEAALKRRIAAHGLAQEVRITGFVSQDQVVRFYQDADLFVLPLVSKIHWGIPNVLIEALATKTPVVCCDLPSMKELVEHGLSGWIIPEGEPATLAQAIKALWADPALRRRLAEAGHQRVTERFALERTGEALRALFATVRS